MGSMDYLVVTATALVLVAGPLLLGMAGRIRAARTPAPADSTPWDWKLGIVSALLHTLAFNLTFFIQELFLVLPKALTPGLRPTLFHNNHRWDGTHPLASLFQGTGVLATLLAAGVCALLLHRAGRRSVALRLFLIWMVYCGSFMALPQFVIGALSDRSDVGMAMAYLDLGATAKALVALVALAAIPLIALGLVAPLLGLAQHDAWIATARERSRFVFRVATLPALAAIVLIIPFRVPRELVEVVLLPAWVAVIGIAWMQAGAWWLGPAEAQGGSGIGSIIKPLIAVVLLFLVFQGLLRPGIRFY